MSKILLTGSSGFLGSNIKNHIILNNQIFELNRNTGSYKIDLTNDRARFNTRFDIAIHCAGRAHMYQNSSIKKNLFYEVNVKGTQNLLHGLNNDLEKFIFISSVSVYGLNSGILINEETELKAKDPYGQSKIDSEYILQEWCYKYNVKLTILRLPLVAGPNPPGNLNSMIRGIKNGYYFNVNGGISNKSIVLASDISRFILKAGEVGGIYNLTDGNHPTIYDISNCIAKQLNKNKVRNLPLFFAEFLATTGDILGNKFPINSLKLKKIISTLTFDDTKARKSFDWSPKEVIKNFIIQ